MNEDTRRRLVEQRILEWNRKQERERKEIIENGKIETRKERVTQ